MATALKPKTIVQLSKLQQWTIDSLNEYAFADARGQLMAGHTPASPMFWFAGLARETAVVWKDPQFGRLLNRFARTRMRRLGIEVGC